MVEIRPATPPCRAEARRGACHGAEIAEDRPRADEVIVDDALLVQMLERTRDCVKLLTLDGRLVMMNLGGREALRIPDFESVRGADWLSFWKGEDHIVAEQAVEAARSGGVGRFTGYFPTLDGEPRWWDVVVNPMVDDRNRPQWLLAVSRDVTEQRAAGERQRLLREELNHRVNNTLAAVVALATQTARFAASPQAFNFSFQRRLKVLAAAHDLLARRSWDKVEIAEVVHCLLDPDLRPRVALEGGPAPIAARAAVSLALALHELAQNAATHGALSAPEGRVTVAWSEPPGSDEVELNWCESSSALVRPPEREGLGLRLVRLMVQGDLGGRVELDFQPSGLKAAMRFKAAGTMAYRTPSAAAE